MMDEQFGCELEHQLVFMILVNACTTATVLRHFNYEREVVAKTASSDYVSDSELLQYDDESVLHPMEYICTMHTPGDCV